jgi:hypothetical protein
MPHQRLRPNHVRSQVIPTRTLIAADEDVALATLTQVGNSPAISEKITSSYLSPADPRALAIRGAITYWRR